MDDAHFSSIVNENNGKNDIMASTSTPPTSSPPASPSSNIITTAVGPSTAKDHLQIEIPDSFNRRHVLSSTNTSENEKTTSTVSTCNGVGGADHGISSGQHHHYHHHHPCVTTRIDRNYYGDEDYCRAILAFLFAFFGMVSNLVILAIVHERVPLDITHPLPDLGFDLLPEVDWTLDIAEYIILAVSALIIFLLFIHRHRVIIFKRISLMMGIIYLFRGICMISTVFPLANRHYPCQPQLHNGTQHLDISFGEYVSTIASRVGYMLLGFGLSINGRHSYCGDYLFSGHTVILTLGFLVLREYLMPSRCRTIAWKLFHCLLFLSCFGGVICVIISRGHYLIDIILAYYVTTMVFWIYHTLVYNHSLLTSSSTNYLSRIWWFRLLLFFEKVQNCRNLNCDHPPCQSCTCDSPVPVIPRSLEWPLPWPRFLRRRKLPWSQQRLLTTQVA
ncbi:phosphatidylcholine:ceramide cholinephosphotransferase 2-like isoform X3 [Panonychus citri]|nr:phosphatidylcholine:ceramide cholinephosphotransferase 2-like isoform X3 [Panonychus citri]